MITARANIPIQRREPWGPAGAAVLAPPRAEELGKVVGAGEAALDRCAADGKEHPREGEKQTDLAKRHIRPKRGGFDEVGLDAVRLE
jgi:hypothetical protein